MLPKKDVPEEVLLKIFTEIFDTYFIKWNNSDAIRYLELVEIIETVPRRIAAFREILKFHWETPTEIWEHPKVLEIRNRHIEKLNQYLADPIDLDADFTEEVHRTVVHTLSLVELEYAEAEMEIEDMRKGASKSKFDFYDSLEAINQVNGTNYNGQIMLAQYVAAEKSATRKTERQKWQTS